MQSFSAAPGHLESLASFVYMAVVSSLASAAFSRQHRPAKTQQAKESLNPSWSSLRQGNSRLSFLYPEHTYIMIALASVLPSIFSTGSKLL